MNKKTIISISAIFIIVMIAVGGSFYLLGRNASTPANNSAKSSATSAKKSVEKSSSSATSSSSSIASSSSWSAGGENASAASEASSVMKADTGAPITDEVVQDAAKALKDAGIDISGYTKVDIAKVVNKANNDSLDYKTAFEELYGKQ